VPAGLAAIFSISGTFVTSRAEIYAFPEATKIKASMKI